MRITILTHLENEDDEKTYDLVVDHVAEALRENRHRVSILGVHGDVRKLVDGLETQRPDLVFNLMETFGTSQLGQIGVVGLLDMLGVRYTGGGPGEYYLQEDKSITKKLLAFENIRYPDFAVFGLHADMETGGNLRMPLFVKPLRMDASIGINAKSLVYSTKEMMQRVRDIHKLNDSALAEEFIDGREFFVSIMGNQTPQAFPLIEIDFTGLPDGVPKVLDAKAKWDRESVEFKGTQAVLAEMPDEMRARIQKVAVDAYRALRVRDYGRIDLRVADTGDIYVIEVNASCYLEKDAEFAKAAAAAGIEYPALMQRIVELTTERWAKRR